ncbi:MAG: RNAseH domain-containing protein [Actinomycetota bacterium]|nr:RNAseH domain-containing protein [Actinomycetota bacterium]
MAALTARLCQQAASWDDRTQSPTPLHLAERPDLDHPQRAEQPEETEHPD